MAVVRHFVRILSSLILCNAPCLESYGTVLVVNIRCIIFIYESVIFIGNNY